MENKSELLAKFKDLLDEISSKQLNKDQKELAYEILSKFPDNKLEYVFQFICQRIKTGFRFDIAPEANSKVIGILQKDQSMSFELNPNKLNQNSLIISENYDALKNLIVIERERERAGLEYKYDLIYIDPPYNTETSKDDGNSIADDKENIKANKFIYRDKYSRNGWLNLMNERLRLARQLLKDDGVIFVSIDDAEQAYLKVLMDEIFGEENFVGNFVWQKKNAGSADDAKYIKILNEYVLMYSKNINLLETNSQDLDTDDKSYNNEDEHILTRGKYKLNQLDRASLTWSKGLDYIIEHNGQTYYPGKSKENWQKRQNGEHAEKDWQWRWSKEKVQWGIQNDYLVFQNDKVYSKQYQFADNEGNLIHRSSKFSNLILDAHGSNGTKEQKDIFNTKTFDHPKPTLLIKYIINLIKNKNSRILDFFAGSGTTGHAVLDLNKEDGGNRTFTLVTNNENNIAQNITYERLYRINQGKGTENQDFPWLKNNKPYLNNLNVYKMNYYNVDLFNNQKNIDQLIQLLTELLIDFGLNKEQIQNLKEINLLTDLSSLKPLIKDEDGTN
ncbi:site-specific DNA-methyltransferase [Mycoplasmopsis felis]|uniref:site-specific DNA-methyltransferase n=1 Tax=Mycoplasmopsis felis TaxID=33923 RepID=UPI003A4D68DA